MLMMLMCLFSGAAKKFPPVLQYTGGTCLLVPALSLVDLSVLLDENQKKDKFTTMTTSQKLFFTHSTTGVAVAQDIESSTRNNNNNF